MRQTTESLTHEKTSLNKLTYLSTNQLGGKDMRLKSRSAHGSDFFFPPQHGVLIHYPE